MNKIFLIEAVTDKSNENTFLYNLSTFERIQSLTDNRSNLKS